MADGSIRYRFSFVSTSSHIIISIFRPFFLLFFLLCISLSPRLLLLFNFNYEIYSTEEPYRVVYTLHICTWKLNECVVNPNNTEHSKISNNNGHVRQIGKMSWPKIQWIRDASEMEEGKRDKECEWLKMNKILYQKLIKFS